MLGIFNRSERRSNLLDFCAALACLSGVMGILFAPSFRAHLTLFSNDGPLGVIRSQADCALSNFLGAWQHLNWLGGRLVSSPPDFAQTLFLLMSAVPFSKFYVPISLIILGLSGWLLLKQLELRPSVCILGALAFALNTDPFSYACWGLASLALTMADYVLALAALAGYQKQGIWLRTTLAGSAIGLAVMEGFDSGAIFSLYVAAFALFQSWNRGGGSAVRRLAHGVARVAFVALIAALTSAHTVSVLVQTQIQGVAGMEQDRKSKEERWDQATQWSLPKVETLRVVIPGLFGYRMDTPEGGHYWGSVGQTPGWERHHQGYPRHSGSGVYAGVLVVLVAAWALAQAARGSRSPFPLPERRLIWFWGAMTLISLLMAFGRHAPFYQLVYALPYFSTIRNPIKFIHPFTVSLIILFGFGLQDLLSRCLRDGARKGLGPGVHLKQWWISVPVFERRWTLATTSLVGLSILGWLLYLSSKKELQSHFATIGFGAEQAAAMTAFSLREVAWFVFFLALAVALLTAIISGWFCSLRQRLAGLFLGALLTIDLGRANQPWIIYYDYREQYASNPVIDLLRENPYERRVTGQFPRLGNYPQIAGLLSEIYGIHWLQHLFQYYSVQSLDIVQMPRMPQLDESYRKAFLSPREDQLPLYGRLWQLTNTRFILGAGAELDFLNQRLDPVRKRFLIHTQFDLVPKSSAPAGGPTKAEEITAILRPGGSCAVFEFTGALPRASLFTNWQASTNDQATLQTLADPSFDPSHTVLISNDGLTNSLPSDTAGSTGSVKITSYHPKKVELQATTEKPSVLLLNDRYDPDWQVSIDGQPARLLRCNYIMRGVSLPPGTHTIAFQFRPSITWFYVSLSALALGLVLCGFLVLRSRSRHLSATPEFNDPAPAKS